MTETAFSVIAVVISAISLLSMLYFNLKSGKRTETKDNEEYAKERVEEIKERTKENAIITGKLDLINLSNQEIKEQISSLVKKVDAHGDRLTKTEESLKSVWKRIDSIEQRLNKEDGE